MILRLPTPLRRGAPAALGALALAVSVMACGGASGDGGVVSLASPSAAPGQSAAPTASIDPEDAMLAFEKCMKEHGVDIQVAIVGEDGDMGGVSVSGPEPGTEPQRATGPLDREKLAEADKACRDLLPAAGQMDPNATIPPEQVEAMLAFSKCMRDHGIDYPDPVFDSGGGGVSIQIGGPDGEGGIDPSTEAFQAAQEACAKDMPGGGPFVVGGSAVEPETKP